MNSLSRKNQNDCLSSFEGVRSQIDMQEFIIRMNPFFSFNISTSKIGTSIRP